ncbi:hypothetical protein BDV28DRAFT_150350 [Aspergillus coremiiformis]|uniref:NTP binding protein n=1 Tax=Aspergillus coremiiformis TaxID=138285 RepID=A0A5N6Z044_9EURO|nr:hypothetical protein BDV28DRAFT_150350 [Aspergillus coremiiformis]
MDEYIHMPNRHLLNLQRRARNGKRANFNNEGAENNQNEGYATGADQKSAESKGGSPKTPPHGLLRRGRPTKLPKPRPSIDKSKDQKKDESVKPRKKVQNFNSQNERSPGVSDRESPRTTEKDREQYWRKVREKFDRDSPTTPRSKDKQKDYYEACRKILSLASTSKQEIAKHKLKIASPTRRDQRTFGQGAKSRTEIVGPSVDSPGSPVSNSRGHSTSQNGSQSSKDRRAGQGILGAIPQRSLEKIDNTTDLPIRSHHSVSPVSDPSSLAIEWEDKFVVNMPSARDPNPPTMSVEQIVEFQNGIEKFRKEGEAMLDPDILPSPRTTTPEDKPSQPEPEGRQLSTLDGQDSRSGHSADEQAPAQPSGHNQYYSPDEVGKQRFSTIWEEASRKPRQKTPKPNADGSFLGCREINGPYDKNPDEILFFSTTNERPRVVDISASMAKPRDSKKITTPIHPMTPALEGKSVTQEEWKPISQNLKHVQCCKQSPKTMCRETTCQPQEKLETPTRASGKENTYHVANAARTQHQRKNQGHDVSIIIPTITHTMVTVADTGSAAQNQLGIHQPQSRMAGDTTKDARVKPQMNSSPSGLRRATQNSWERSNAACTTPSRGTPITSIPVAQQAPAEPKHMGGIERRRAIRGYIRMPGVVKSRTENLGQPTHNSSPSQAPVARPSQENQSPTKRISDSSQCVSFSAQNIAPASSLTRHQRDQKSPVQTARIVDVAELDGLQVDDPKDERKTDQKADRGLSDKYTHKEPLHSKVTDLRTDLQITAVQPNYRGVLNSVTMSLVMDIFVLSAAQAQELFTQIMNNRHSMTVLVRIALNWILNMIEHCLYVFKDLLHACSVYTTTGAWPKPNERDLARLFTDLCRAMIYLFALGFILMLVGRAVGYVVLVGSWIAWFIRPLGWFLSALGRVLLGMTS